MIANKETKAQTASSTMNGTKLIITAATPAKKDPRKLSERYKYESAVMIFKRFKPKPISRIVTPIVAIQSELLITYYLQNSCKTKEWFQFPYSN